MTNKEIVGLLNNLLRPIYAVRLDGFDNNLKEKQGYKTDFSKCRIIFNKENTILIDDKGHKYVSITGHGDAFDKEKGVMMCMLKALGYNFTDISNLLNTVKEK